MRIEARNITCRAGRRLILDGVDLAFGTGEMVGLIGPNGAGKSTLLRILAGLRPPEGGTVTHDGNRLTGRDLARKLAFLAQGGEVNWALRVEHLVALGRLPHRRFGPPGTDDLRAVENALAAAEVTELRDRIVSTLSGGERMRVLLARALAVEAAILLADEPVTALDPYHQLRVMELLRAQADGGKGIVVVLHDLTLAHRFCDRLVLLDRGRIVADASPREVLSDARTEAAYGVRLLRGRTGTEEYVLPWERVAARNKQDPQEGNS